MQTFAPYATKDLFMKAKTTLKMSQGLAFCATLCLACTAKGADLYVATNGADTNPGTRSKPFATFERARDAARQLRRTVLTSPINVWVRGGDYLRTNALELTAADSGPSPTTWSAYQHEKVRWLGGRILTGFGIVTNPAVLARLPENARSKVRQIDLHALGITSFGDLSSRGFGRPQSVAHCELFCGGKPMTLARWPNEGSFAQIAGFPESGAHKDEHGGDLGKLTDGFVYSGDRLRDWKDTEDIWVHGYWAWDWANSYERIASLDLERHLIKTASPYGHYGFRKGQRIFFLNVLEELDQPGEWFLDRAAGVLYFWPPEGALSDKKEVVLSLLPAPFLKITGASNITCRRFVLEATRANAVEVHSGSSNLIAGCVMRNIGNSGVTINGGFGHGVRDCDVFDTGDGGVSLGGGDRQSLTPAGHFVENCDFVRQGRWSKCYVPAIQLDGVGMRASHNLIHEHPHCAILFNGNNHLIEFNEIHHIALETGDVGAIYAGRDYTYRGNRIRYNFIHHTGGVGMGSMGVYMDDCVSGTEIFGNIFYKVQRAAFLGGGRDHRVVNNVFVECNHAVELDGRGLDATPVWHDMVNDTMRQRLTEIPLPLYRERYPDLRGLDKYYGPPGGDAITGPAFKGVPPENNVVARNICVGKWLNVYWHATKPMLLLENNLTDADPQFVAQPSDSAKAVDFALKQSSPAGKLGFERIPVEKIGLRR